jgi:predicted nucleic acid-binding protein
MKRIYLDVCSLCRPFDNQDYARISLETDAINLIITGVRAIDEFEKKELLHLLEEYGNENKPELDIIKKRTEELILIKFGIADAAHVAFSEYYGSIFISCDDKLLNKCNRSGIKVLCVNPVTFCEMEKLK